MSREVVHARNQQVYAGNDAQSTVFGRFWPILTIFDVLSYWGSSRGYTRRLPVPVSAGTWPLAGRVKGHAQNTPGLPLAFTSSAATVMSERSYNYECWSVSETRSIVFEMTKHSVWRIEHHQWISHVTFYEVQIKYFYIAIFQWSWSCNADSSKAWESSFHKSLLIVGLLLWLLIYWW